MYYRPYVNWILFRAKADPGSRYETTLKLTPVREGIHTVVVDMDADQVIDIKTFANLEVVP